MPYTILNPTTILGAPSGGGGGGAVNSVTAGAGVVNSGSAADPVIDVAATDASIVVGANSIGVGVLQSAAQHGNIATASAAHAAVIAGGNNGFMTGADKTKLDAITLDANGLTLTQAAAPAAQAQDQARIFLTRTARITVPELMREFGASFKFQKSIKNNTVLYLPNITTSVGISFGTQWTGTATISHPTVTSASLIASLRRSLFTTTAVANDPSGIRGSSNMFWRGNAALLGGFEYYGRISVDTYDSGMQIINGLWPTVVLAGEPSVINNSCGLCKDSTDTNWQLWTRSATTTSKVDLGLAVAANQVLDLYMFAAPNGSDVYAMVINVATGAVVGTGVYTLTQANLPTNTVFMAGGVFTRTTTANAVAVGVAKIEISSDI